MAAAVLTIAAAAILQHGTSASADSSLDLTWHPADPAAEAPGALYAASASTVHAVTIVAGTAQVIDFRGWRGTAPKAVLSPTASMLSTDRSFATSPTGGTDGASLTFDPQASDFGISVWVKPTAAALFPLGDLRPSAVSPNIVQKGLSNAAGGYWKISTLLVPTSAGLRWAPLCSFRSDAGDVLTVNRNAAHRLVLSDESVGATIDCRLSEGTATMTVTPDGGLPESLLDTATGPFTISNADAVSVGHPPRSKSATDIYDGLIAHLVITSGSFPPARPPAR